MQHSDPDVLALVALGERPPSEDAAHLRTCARCQDEVADLARVVDAARVDAPPGPPVPPPPRVWAAIAAGTGVTVAPRDVVTAPLAVPAVSPARRRSSDAPSGTGRRRLLLAVAASLVVGAAGGASGATLLRERGAPAQPPAAQVLAQVDLANLKRTAATGRAVVVRTATGPRLRVDTSALAPTQGHFYEVWLIDRRIDKMVGIGILHPGEDEFAVPDGVDLARYPVVDISVQAPGDPRHSGDSVLRGTIRV